MTSRRRNKFVRFTEEEKALLDRYLPSYRRLVEEKLPANTPARRRFVAVAAGKLQPVAIHEIAFVKWQMWICLRPYAPIGANPETVEAETIRSGAPRSGRPPEASPALSDRIRSEARTIVEKVKSNGTANWDQVAGWFNAALGTDLALQLDRWMRDSFATGKATVYDKAMDAAHIANPSGPFHRLWDGGHSLTDAWRAVQNATPDDTFTQEVAGYMSAIWKDVITPMGLPIMTIDRDWFNATAASLRDHAITKHDLADAISYTGSELAGAALGAVALLLNWEKPDIERAAGLAGSLGVSTICAANPVLGIVAVVCLARAIQTARNASSTSAVPIGLMKGGVGSFAFVAAGSLVGGPVWVTIVVGVVASMLAQSAISKGATTISEVDWAALSNWVVSGLRSKFDITSLLVLKTS